MKPAEAAADYKPELIANTQMLTVSACAETSPTAKSSESPAMTGIKTPTKCPVNRAGFRSVSSFWVAISRNFCLPGSRPAPGAGIAIAEAARNLHQGKVHELIQIDLARMLVHTISVAPAVESVAIELDTL